MKLDPTTFALLFWLAVGSTFIGVAGLVQFVIDKLRQNRVRHLKTAQFKAEYLREMG